MNPSLAFFTRSRVTQMRCADGIYLWHKQANPLATNIFTAAVRAECFILERTTAVSPNCCNHFLPCWSVDGEERITKQNKCSEACTVPSTVPSIGSVHQLCVVPIYFRKTLPRNNQQRTLKRARERDKQTDRKTDREVAS